MLNDKLFSTCSSLSLTVVMDQGPGRLWAKLRHGDCSADRSQLALPHIPRLHLNLPDPQILPLARFRGAQSCSPAPLMLLIQSWPGRRWGSCCRGFHLHFKHACLLLTDCADPFVAWQALGELTQGHSADADRRSFLVQAEVFAGLITSNYIKVEGMRPRQLRSLQRMCTDCAHALLIGIMPAWRQRPPFGAQKDVGVCAKRL